MAQHQGAVVNVGVWFVGMLFGAAALCWLDLFIEAIRDNRNAGERSTGNATQRRATGLEGRASHTPPSPVVRSPYDWESDNAA